MRKVIVQDTNCDLLETITLILEAAHYEVLPVLRYQDVVPQIDKFNPKLILLDYMLSGEESKYLCKKIKERFPLLPIIALSCNYNIESEFAQAGFDDYLTKPFELDDLFLVVQKFL